MSFEVHAMKTKELFEKITSDETKWSPYRQIVANVFNAYPYRALTVDQINMIGRAVEALPTDATVEDALVFYVRHKVLRSRRENGKRLYEVNF